MNLEHTIGSLRTIELNLSAFGLPKKKAHKLEDSKLQILQNVCDSPLTVEEEQIHQGFRKFLRDNCDSVSTFYLYRRFSSDTNEIIKRKLENILDGDVYSHELRRFIVLNHAYFESCYLWGFQYLSGDDLKLFNGVAPAVSGTGYALAQNVTLDWDIVWECVFSAGSHKSWEFKNDFVKHLNATVFKSEGFLNKLITLRRWVVKKENIVVKRYREVFNLDESIPDAWIERLITEGGSNG